MASWADFTRSTLVFPAAGIVTTTPCNWHPEEFRWAYYAAYLADTDGRTRLALERYEQARTLKPGYKALTVRTGEHPARS